MRIIFVTPEFLSKNKPSTGLPNYLYRVSKALIGMGHIPIIVTGGEKNEHVFFDGIEVYREETFNRSFSNKEIGYIYNSITNGYKLKKIVQKICHEVKVDIIQYASLYGLGMFHIKDVPSIIRLSSYAKIYYKSLETYSNRYVKIMSFIERIATKKIDGIIAPSNIMAKEFQKDIHKKVHVIETPFVNDVKKMDDSVLKKKIGEKKYILFFGTLYAEKGIYVIADIIYDVLDRYQDYYFVFIGENERHNKENPLQTLYHKADKHKNRIIYISPLSHEQLYPIIKSAVLVTLPSLMENLSNACIEAMYFEKIVIATQDTSFEQLIVDGKNGYLSIPNNASSLLKKIDLAMQLSGEGQSQMGREANKRIKYLRPEIAVKRLVNYYTFVINKHR